MKYIIWDYNGTILDDVGISVQIENQMLEKRHLKAGYTIEDYQKMFSIPMYDYYIRLGYTFEDETFEQAAHEFNDLYEQLFETCDLNEGVMELLIHSKQQGYQNVILSSCYKDTLIKQVDALGITSYFETIMGIEDKLGGSKIHLGIDWMKENSINPSDCIFIGDTLADYETAKQLGIKTIYLIANGHQSYDRLKKVNDLTFHSLKEISL